ncbi:MAG TPA: hypothetical protein VNQ77_11785 [Frankiaceae bacterium]|nr:hypothetical protein [Frankiaceae bacterium]
MGHRIARVPTVCALAAALFALPAGGGAAHAGANCSHNDHTHRHWHGFDPHTHHWNWDHTHYVDGERYEVFFFEEGDRFESSSGCGQGQVEGVGLEGGAGDVVSEVVDAVQGEDIGGVTEEIARLLSEGT